LAQRSIWTQGKVGAGGKLAYLKLIVPAAAGVDRVNPTTRKMAIANMLIKHFLFIFSSTTLYVIPG
jgi:hypothetical protein